MNDDPDPETRAELEKLLAAPDPQATDLADRFAGTLEFGTAGLRGVIGAGPNRMNRAVVLRTTWGLAEHLLAAVPDVKERGVVIGYDGRRLSPELAEDTACVLAARGIPALVFTDFAPTPLTAFAVKHLHAAAGVMVTASHNPPEYNGYKVYWGNGAQIIPPIDAQIASAILRAPAAKDVPRLELAEAKAKRLVRTLGDDVARAYLDAVRGLGARRDGDRALTIVYTPMHGVGDALARKALAESGFTRVTSVPEQQKPDGRFPTVAFPNPEEKGAMDLAFALARKERADLVLANDPDADRLAVAIPDAASPSGYLQLTGNQVGVLFGHYLLTEGEDAGASDRLVLASVVSSPMLGAIAAALGVRYEETLTGFKWIANRAMEIEKADKRRFIFGYEEALGYTVGDLVRDKDGIGAAVVMAEIAAVSKSRGRTLKDELEAIARRFGLFVSAQVSVTRPGADGASEIRALMDRLRADPPSRVGEHAVVAVSDYQARERKTLATGAREALALPPSNVLGFALEGGARVLVRPSGTEPKIKFYFDLREVVREGEPFADAERRAAASLKALCDAFSAKAKI